MIVSSNSAEVALAQSADQTLSAASAPPPAPMSQAMQSTFHAKGVIGILILNPNATQSAPPPPSKSFGTIVGGNWSLDVVSRSIQNFTMNMLSLRPDGTIAEAALVSTVTNVTAASSTSPLNATSAASNNSNTTTTTTNDTSTTTNNTIAFQGVANVSINGTVRWRDVPFAITVMQGTLINISMIIQRQKINSAVCLYME